MNLFRFVNCITADYKAGTRAYMFVFCIISCHNVFQKKYRGHKRSKNKFFVNTVF